MKKKIVSCIVLCSSIIFGTVPAFADALPLPTAVRVVSMEDEVKPEIPKGTGYAVVNLNIRKEPDKNSAVVGRYQKGEQVNIISDDGLWAKTDKGYVWGGYLANEYKCNLSVRSESELSSRYVGYLYDKLNNMEEKYVKVLQQYDICLCDNPVISYNNTVNSSNPLPEDMVINGVTHLYDGNGEHKRIMFFRASKSALDDSLYHELGHAIDFEPDTPLSDAQVVTDSMETERNAVKDKFHLSTTNTSTNAEYFAEAFRISFEDPEGLKETAPNIAAFVEQVKASV